MAALTPINSLDPGSSPPPDKTIRAVVALYWPYSSSTKQCAFLLTDPDPRIRSRRGQVRVRFTLASATAVAYGKVGIGDEVCLDLRGAQWSSYTAKISTPGKSVEGELVYRGELSLRVVRKAGSSGAIDQRIDVNESTPPPDEDGIAHETPARDPRVTALRYSFGGGGPVPVYSSPAFIRQQRLSGDSFGSAGDYDPFADLDQELDDEQPRKRQRISDVSFWRFGSGTPSPQKQTTEESSFDQTEWNAATVEIDQDNYQSDSPSRARTRRPLNARQSVSSLPVKLSPLPPAKADVVQQLGEPPTSMLPPPLPHLRIPAAKSAEPVGDQGDLSPIAARPATPELRAVPAHNLPLPSPFPRESAEVSIEKSLDSAPSNAIESMPEDGVMLEINPTIAAFASQQSQISKASSSHKSSGESPRPRPQRRRQPNTGSGSFELETKAEIASQSTGIYAPKSQPDSYPDVYPDHQNSGSDTEEDEYMQNLYSQRAQSHARDMLEREGVKIRDWVHRDDADEVIEDMGERPDTSSDEDFDDDDDENDNYSNGDQELLSDRDDIDDAEDIDVQLVSGFRAPDVEQSGIEPATAQALNRRLFPNSSGRPQTRGQTIVRGTAPDSAQTKYAGEAQNVQPATTMALPLKSQDVMKEVAVEAATSPTISGSTTEAGTELVASTGTLSAASRTPSKTLRSLFGFGFGMDGTTDDQLQAVRTTPESEKDRSMKKTYSSLFGFKASPSPEKEASADRMLETPTPFSSVQREVPDSVEPRSLAQDASNEGSVQPLAAQEISPPVIAPSDHSSDGPEFGSYHDAMHVDEPAADSQSILDPTLREHANREQLLDVSAAPAIEDELESQHAFPSLAVEVSETSRSGPDGAPTKAVMEEQRPASQSSWRLATTRITSTAPLALSGTVEPLSASVAAAGTAAESHMSADHGGPLKNETLMESMVRDATPLPSNLENSAAEHDGEAASPQLEIPESLVSDYMSRSVASPSSAPAEVVESQNVSASHASPAPSTSHVEAIDLETGDQSDDESEIARMFQSVQPNANVSRELIADNASSHDRSYSPTEVASSPLVPETIDVEMRDAALELGTSRETTVQPGQEGGSTTSDSHMESFFEDEKQGMSQDLSAEQSTAASLPNQAVGVSSTQRRKMSDHFRHFSSQSNASDADTSIEGVPSGVKVAQESAGSLAEAFEYQVTTSREQSLSQTQSQVNQQSVSRLTRASARLASAAASVSDNITKQNTTLKPQSQHAPASDEDQPFVDSFPEETRQPDLQQSMQTELPSPQDSQPQQLLEVPETQDRIESQPFESQLALPKSPIPKLLPTPETTNEGLKIGIKAPIMEEAVSATSKRRHARKVSVKDNMAVLRSSPRGSDAQTSQEPAAAPSTRAQTRSRRTASPGAPGVTRMPTRSQRTASPEPSQMITRQQVRSQRTSTPETTRPPISSFDGSSLSPDVRKPPRRSLRKSLHQAEEGEVDDQDLQSSSRDNSRKAAARKSARKLHVQQSPEEEASELEQKTTDFGDTTLVSEQNAFLQRLPSGAADLKESDTFSEPTTSVLKTPGRKSFATRLGQVPEVISSWFSPRRSTRQTAAMGDTTLVNESSIADKTELLKRTSTNGLITSHGYYMPLSNLHEKLNSSSQPGLDNTIDLLAVVTDATKAPERAKGGPRDYFTIFKIADPSTATSKDHAAKASSTRVEVFRPWHATLPVAQPGDIILLRGFAVKSRKRQPYLLSTDASAWLVWRFGEGAVLRPASSAGSPTKKESKSTPTRGRGRAGSLVGAGVKEEVKGPPVELGTEERGRAGELRAWWQEIVGKQDDGRDEEK